MGFSKVLWIEKNRVNVLLPSHFTLFILVNKIHKKKNYKNPMIYQFALFLTSNQLLVIKTNKYITIEIIIG